MGRGKAKMEVTDLSTLLSTLPGSVSQECKGVRNSDTVMKSKKEELRKFKLSWKLLEELPDAIKEEEKHRGLRKGKLRGWKWVWRQMGRMSDVGMGTLRRSGSGNQLR